MAADISDALRQRHLMATLSLDTATYQQIARHFQEHAQERHPTPWTCHHLQSDGPLDGIPQTVAVTVVGEHQMYWEIKYPMRWDVGSRKVFRVRKGLIDFDFHDVLFTLACLEHDDISLYRDAATHLDIHIECRRREKTGISMLGWTINRFTLPLEWVADWTLSTALWPSWLTILSEPRMGKLKSALALRLR